MKYSGPITVLMATRDRWPRLTGRSLPSIAAQSRRPDQIVVVNDGHPFAEDKVEAIRDIVAPTPVVVLENQRARGAAGAWNTGLTYIGERQRDGHIALLDDDDVWEPNHLEVNESAAREHDASIAVSGLRLVVDNVEQPRPFVDAMTDRDFLVGNPGWQGSNTFVRLSLLRKVGGFRDGMASLNDRDLAIRLLRTSGVTVAYVRRWTAAWFLDTGGNGLSVPRSAAKIAGLRWFWHIYGHEMTPDEVVSFFHRTARLFGVQQSEIVGGDKGLPPHVEARGDWR